MIHEHLEVNTSNSNYLSQKMAELCIFVLWKITHDFINCRDKYQLQFVDLGSQQFGAKVEKAE